MMKTNDDKRKSDLKRYLKNNLDSVQCVTDVLEKMKDKFVNFEIKENINIDDLYADLSRSQRTAQLILNLYTDSETYRSCLIDQSFDMKSEDPISKFYEKESRTEPEQSDVVDAIYNYVLCYLRVQYYEVCELIKKNNMKFKDIICPMCDTAFCDDNVLCPLCSYSIVEAMKDVLKSQKKVKINKNQDQEMSEPVSHQDLSICKQCKKYTTIISEEMCGDCFNARWSAWICPYKLCKSTNTERNKYCKSCGIKRSPVLIVDTPIERWKNEILDKVWICGECHHLNDNIENEICGQCSIAMNKSSQQTGNHSENEGEFVLVEKYNNKNNPENNQLNFDHKSQWKCDRCELINDVAFLSCQCCNWARMIIWTCSHCSKENEESVQQCAACGCTNENTEKKLCVKCQRGELIINGLCAQCESERLSDWRCSYRFCGNINIGTNEFCQFCHLYRYGIMEHGAPIIKMTNNNSYIMWVCLDCGGVNRWADWWCQNIRAGYMIDLKCNSKRYKYFRWCKLCKNKNQSSDIKCRNCEQYLND